MVQLAFGLLGAAALAAVIIGCGARLRDLLRLPVPASLRLSVDFVVGSWMVGVCVLLLGLVHALYWSALTALVVCLGAAGRYAHVGWRWRPAVPALLAGLVALPVALAPPFFYDALVYHLGLPWQALQEHGISPHPEDVFAAFPALVQLLDAPLIAIGLDRAPAVLHWFAFVAAGTGIWGLARALGAPGWAALLASASLPVLPCIVLVPGLPAAEAWCVASAVMAFTLVARRRWPPGTAALVGFLSGVAAAARLQGLPWGLVILAAVLLRTGSPRSTVVSACGWLAGCAPWWIKNAVLLRAPLAPILWHREGMETLWRDAGSSLHTARDAGQLVHSTFGALAPHGSYLGILALAAVFAAAVRATARDRITAAAVVAGLGIWALTGNLPRFLAISAGLLVAMAASAAGRSPTGRWVSGLALGVTLVIGLTVSVSEAVRWRVLWAAAGNPKAVREEMVVNDPFPAFVRARSLPERARVLFIGEPRGFGFPRPFVAPSQHDVSPLRSVLAASRSPAEACKKLRGQGFTHLLVNWGELGRLATTYPVAPWRDPRGWRRWNAFVASLGAPVVQANGVQVFVLPGQSGRGV